MDYIYRNDQNYIRARTEYPEGFIAQCRDRASLPQPRRFEGTENWGYQITEILEHGGNGRNIIYRVLWNNSDIEWVERSTLDPFPTVRQAYQVHCRRERQKKYRRKRQPSNIERVVNPEPLASPDFAPPNDPDIEIIGEVGPASQYQESVMSSLCDDPNYPDYVPVLDGYWDDKHRSVKTYRFSE